MLIEEKGVIISARRFQEGRFIVKCLLEHSGVIAGLHSTSGTKLGMQPPVGSIVYARWRARLHEQLGFFTLEMIKDVVSIVTGSKVQELALDSALTLISIIAPEKEPQAQLFKALLDFITQLKTDDDKATLIAYIKFEIFGLLGSSGFGLDLTKCAATGSTEELTYISPKSASAVSTEAGKPYESKLLKLPQFLLSHEIPCSIEDLKDAYKASIYFLNKHLFAPYNRIIPIAREILQHHVLTL